MSSAPVSPVLSSVASQRVSVQDLDSIVEPFCIRDEAEFFGLLNLERPELRKVKAAVAAKDWNRAKAEWARHLQTRTNAKWFWSYRDQKAIKRLLKANGQDITEVVPAADKVLARQFTFVGVPKTLDKSPKWEQGVNEWTSVLNRFQYLNPLGRAYWATGNKKYAQDFVDLIQDWIAKNPVPTDINTYVNLGNPWRSLEDGVRTQSWLEAMQFFMDAPEFDAHVKYQLTRSFVEHARYLRAVTIGKGYRAGNWQMHEATSLASLGIMFPEFREAASWRTRGFQSLIEHMQRDVYPDGAMYELTPGYHMGVTEQYLHISLLAQKNGYQVPGLMERHEKMYDFIQVLSQPNRIPAPVGDARRHTAASWLADGALLYNRPDLKFLAGPTPPARWIWTFGPDAFQRFTKMASQRPAFTSYLLPNAQYAVMRTGWEPKDKYLLFDMALWGGGHSHQDRLQVTISAERELLVDPAQYGYDEPLAKYFRTSAAHNVVLVDGKEQPNANPNVLSWETTPSADFASGSIEEKGIRHQRSVLFLKPNYWVVVDHINASDGAEHEVTRLFHFAQAPVKVEGNSVRSTFADGTNIGIQTGDSAALEMRTDWIPVASAKAEEAPLAVFTTKSKLPLTLSTVLTPLVGTQQLPLIESLPGDNSQVAHLAVSFPNGQRDEILIAAEPTELRLGTLKGNGRALYLRRGPDSNEGRLIGTDYTPKTP